MVHGVCREDRVAVSMARNETLVPALLGVLKAGAAYVPIDPGMTGARIRFILEDTSAKAYITGTNRPETSQLLHLQLDSANFQSLLGAMPDVNPDLAIFPEQMAYLIYTSGSTGRPKGVTLHHQGLCNYLDWAEGAYEMNTTGDGAAMHGSIGFDATITSLWLPLKAGLPIHLIPEENELENLSQALFSEKQFNLMKLTPAHLDVLSRLAPETVRIATRYLIVGGEALPPQSLTFWKQHAPDLHIINEYGPTEAVVGCCVYDAPASAADHDRIPIGKSIQGAAMHLTDSWLNPVPQGVAGQLLIAGVGLARGYHGRPGLTAAAFIPNPFSDRPGDRLYRSGDLAVMNDEGQLEYMGRTDHQLKLHGYRIEPGEIEHQLRNHDWVEDALVQLRGEGAHRRLVAWVIGPEKGRPDAAALSARLRQFLPEFMMPSVYMFLEAWPLTHAGKIDRAVLPLPNDEAILSRAAVVPPSTPTQEKLAAIWAEALNLEKVGIHHPFFEIGGNSLLIIRVHAGIKRTFDRHISINDLFRRPTIAELASFIDDDPQTRNLSHPSKDTSTRGRNRLANLRQRRLKTSNTKKQEG